MKYVYILGLEHSGTTLSDYLLSKLPNAIGLGEVASFFKPEHMRSYMAKWGDYDDVSLCSCGLDWNECELWSNISYLNGLESGLDMKTKYQSLFNHLRAKFADDIILIDSSKSLSVLQMVIENMAHLGVSEADIQIVFSIKSPEEFAMSVARKQSNISLINVVQAFNWWVGSNAQMFNFCLVKKDNLTVSPYQQLCDQPSSLLRSVAAKISIAVDAAKILKSSSHSHIAMGNKNFTVRNIDHITYDGEWQSHWQIRLVSLLHLPARRLYKKMTAI